VDFSATGWVMIAGLLVIGASAGFLAGLLGIGGGMIMVPFIKIVLQQVGMPTEFALKVAIATSLTTILFTSFSSVRTHHNNGAVVWPVVLRLAPGIAIGALLGAQIAAGLNTAFLAAFFSIFLAYTGYTMLRAKRKLSAGPGAQLPGSLALAGMGAVIGGLASLVGAGGGFLTVPYLEKRGISMQQAVGCSAACGFPIAAAGAIGYAWAGRHLDISPGTIGFIYWPGLVVIASASIITAHFGAVTAHRMPTAKLRRLFGWVLFLMAGYMLWTAWRSL
jgi:uncharacterized protein